MPKFYKLNYRFYGTFKGFEMYDNHIQDRSVCVYINLLEIKSINISSTPYITLRNDGDFHYFVQPSEIETLIKCIEVVNERQKENH